MGLQTTSPLASEWDNGDVKRCVVLPQRVHGSLEVVDVGEMPEVAEDVYAVAKVFPFPLPLPLRGIEGLEKGLYPRRVQLPTEWTFGGG